MISMNNKIIYPLIVLFTIILGCNRYTNNQKSRNITKTNDLTFSKIAIEKYNYDTVVKYSPKRSYAICKRNPDCL